jgi:hypothetical protein
MNGKRIALKISLKESHASVLDYLVSKDNRTAEDIIDEALDAYLKGQSVPPATEPVTPTIPETSDGSESEPHEQEIPINALPQPGAFRRQFADLKTRVGGSAILVRIPTVRKLWDFSEKANIMVGKRRVCEVYDFKKFLSLGEDQVQEYARLRTRLVKLKNSRLLIRSLEYDKTHSTVLISGDELVQAYETFKDDHYAYVTCLDGTSALVKTAVLKTLRHKEHAMKTSEINIPCGETVVALPGKDDADELRAAFDALTNKLDRVADMIITEYTPIDRKWSFLMDQKLSVLRVEHIVIQSIVSAVLFAIITYFFLYHPRALVPPFYPADIVAGYREFVAAYLMMLPVFGCGINFLLIYVIWYQSTLAFIKRQVRLAIDRDLTHLKRSIEMEL